MLIHEKFYCEGNEIYYKFRDIAEQLSKRQNVKFALFCAKDVFHLVEDEYEEVAKLCLDSVEEWLVNEKSVTSEELRNADNGAFGIWTASAYASAAASAAWRSAYDAFNTMGSYASWSTAAAYAATNATYAAVTANNNKLNEYLVVANSYFTKTNINCPNYEIEGKILYLIDELDENIIVHKDKYYVNMNEIERCPEYGFSTQQELLEKLLYSKDRFWEFARNWLDNLYKDDIVDEVV